MEKIIYPTRSIIISYHLRPTARIWLDNAPDGVEMVLRVPQKQRKSEQNGYMWAGMMHDFVEKGWVAGKQFSEEVWHEYLKRQFLPEKFEDGITLADYRKWDESPSGELILVGSTKRLTVKGFAHYIEQCIAFGQQELGIRFTTIRECAC